MARTRHVCIRSSASKYSVWKMISAISSSLVASGAMFGHRDTRSLANSDTKRSEREERAEERAVAHEWRVYKIKLQEEVDASRRFAFVRSPTSTAHLYLPSTPDPACCIVPPTESATASTTSSPTSTSSPRIEWIDVVP